MRKERRRLLTPMDTTTNDRLQECTFRGTRLSLMLPIRHHCTSEVRAIPVDDAAHTKLVVKLHTDNAALAHHRRWQAHDHGKDLTPLSRRQAPGLTRPDREELQAHSAALQVSLPTLVELRQLKHGIMKVMGCLQLALPGDLALKAQPKASANMSHGRSTNASTTTTVLQDCPRSSKRGGRACATVHKGPKPLTARREASAKQPLQAREEATVTTVSSGAVSHLLRTLHKAAHESIVA